MVFLLPSQSMIQRLSFEINLFIWNTSDLRSIFENEQDPVRPLGMKTFQTVANQERKGMQRKVRRSLETIMQPQGRVLLLPEGIHITMPLSSFTEVNIQEIKIMASSPITSWKIKGEKVEVVTNFIFLGSRITVDSDCSHEIKRCLLIGRKTMTSLDSKFKCQDITLPTEVPLVKAMVFPDVMCGCEISSVTQLCPTLCDSMDCTCQASLPINNSRSLCKLMSIDWVKPSNHFILCCLLLLWPSIFPNIRVFSNESLGTGWPKY